MKTPLLFGTEAKRFCDLVGIHFPVIQAPMAGGWTTPELAAAVANAGGLGMLAAGRLSLAELIAQIAQLRRLTDSSVGVNFILARPEQFDGHARDVQNALNELRSEYGLAPWVSTEVPQLPPSPVESQLTAVLESDVQIISFAMGNPGPLVRRVHAAGKLAFAMATTVDEAVELAESDVDVIVAQGSEAGGHRSTFLSPKAENLTLVGTMALVPSVVDAVGCPVIASGGIMDGRGLAASLALGAAGAQMGTRFLVSAESGAFREYQQRILEARESDTVVTYHFTGRPARAIRNRFVEHMDRETSGALPFPYQALAAEDIYRHGIAEGRSDLIPLLAGQGAQLARSIKPAGQIVADLCEEAERVLGTLAGGVGAAETNQENVVDSDDSTAGR